MRVGNGAAMQALEPRVLLAVAAIDDLKQGPLAKVGTALAGAWAEYQSYVVTGRAADGFAAADPLLRESDGKVAIEAYAADDAAALENDLRALEMSDVRRFENVVTGLLPYSKIAQLASLQSLSLARPVWMDTRAVTSQGDAALRADLARSTYGFTGAGVKVGVLSDSFDTGPGSYSADVGSGDLPAGVQVLQDSANGTDEGRAMAQLVYDSAPGVSLAFATAFVGGQAGFANNIKALRDAGSDIIVDDVIYFAEPMFQDGVIAQAVDNVVASNVPYFSAAGNEGRQAYESAFRSGVTRADGSISGGGPKHFYGGLTHDFDPGAGVDDMQSFTLGANQGITISFQWDQPYGTIPGSASCASDLDVYVLNEAGTQVMAAAATNNSGTGKDPVEVFSFTNGATTRTYNLMIARFAGVSPGLIKYINFGTHNLNEYNTNSGPVFGHPNAAGAAAVGAAAWYQTPAYGVNPPVIEPFSSAGQTPILFSSTGVRLGSAVSRQRPQIVAPDGGNTTFFYSDSASDPDTLPNFFGTSAAAPAAAAVAALLLQAKPSLTPAQIYSALQTTALDMDDPAVGGFQTGYDDGTGFGLVRADAALASVLGGSVSGTAYHDFNANDVLNAGESPVSGATIFADANGNGALDGGEISMTTSANGQFTLNNLPAGTQTVRSIAPGGFVAAAGYPVTVADGTSTSGVNVAHFATTYSGTASDNQFLLRRKAGDAKFEILVGGVLTYTVPATAVTSLTFNLLGGNDSLTVDFANGVAVPTGGVSFDGGSESDTLNIIGSAGAENAVFNTTSAALLGSTVNCSNVETRTFDGSGGGDSLTINGGTVSLDSTQTLSDLIINGGSLDIRNHEVIRNYTGASPIGSWNGAAYTGITGLVAAGRNGGSWNGNGIITSQSAAQSPSMLTTLGVSQTAASVIVKYTFAGDANLDGVINGDDYFNLDSGYSTAASGYFNGDYDYNGRIDADDYFLIDANYNKAQTPLSAAAASELPGPGVFASRNNDSAYRRLMQDDS